MIHVKLSLFGENWKCGTLSKTTLGHCTMNKTHTLIKILEMKECETINSMVIKKVSATNSFPGLT